MDANQSADRPAVCPECGAAFSGEGTYCWLCGWRTGDPVSADPKQRAKPRRNPHVALPNTGKRLQWTFSLSTLFLWTALIAVVMGVVRIAPGLGIPLAVLSLPAALQTTAIALNRRRRSGMPLTLGNKIADFVESMAMVIVFAAVSVFTAIAAFVATCTATGFSFVGSVYHGNGGTLFTWVAAIAGGTMFLGLFAFFFHRALHRTGD
ncbi:MAG TPA: hypothetical protein VHX65_00295 [Pirellulales bacterium]|nr:hypothetical protein [Pirellulales bacterium]